MQLLRLLLLLCFSASMLLCFSVYCLSVEGEAEDQLRVVVKYEYEYGQECR